MNIPWWKTTAFYEIYMPSFSDGNGDGIGDFKGITSKLNYLQELGIGGIWLTPFYTSPKVDNGYDIADYNAVDPDYGTMEDFEEFIAEARARNIRVIVDLVLNHTSSEHAWFQESKSSKANPKRDWYIWKDPVNGGVPNNWESFFGGTAWEYDALTGQYYYHAFAKEQVDLNWANPEVREAMKDVMAFWLNKGVDGFRLDVINFLKVNDTFTDNPYDTAKGEQEHLYDKDQEGILDAIAEICEFVHRRDGVFMVGEVGSEDMDVLKKYSGNGLLDVVFNFNVGSQPELDVPKLFGELKMMEQVHNEDQVPTLFFGSHDMPRHISRFGNGDTELEEKRAKLMATLMLTGKGVPFIYYGDEIGMRDFVAPDISQMKDIQGLTHYELAIQAGKSVDEALAVANDKSRDKSRTPMQWDGSTYGGFSEVEPWISMGPQLDVINVETEQRREGSLLAYYKALLQLRREHPALSVGEYAQLELLNDCTIIYRKRADSEEALIVIHFGTEDVTLNISEWTEIPLHFVLSSYGERTDRDETSFTIRSGESVIWIGHHG